jgi:hypothetical protein
MKPLNDTSADNIDLSAFDEDFRRADHKEPAESYTDDVPDGLYETRVEDVSLRRTANTGNPMLVWRLRILGPQCTGRTISRTRVITQKTIPFLKEDLLRLDLDLDRVSDLERRMGEMLDRQVRVLKRTRQDRQWPDISFVQARRGPASETADVQAWHTGTDDDLPF